MKKSGGKGESIVTRLSNFLFQYRITPNAGVTCGIANEEKATVSSLSVASRVGGENKECSKETMTRQSSNEHLLLVIMSLF